MSFQDSRSARLKLIAIGIFLTLLAILFITDGKQAARASASGPSPSFTDAPGEGNCTACHVGAAINSGDGSIVISGLPSTYTPDQEITVTVVTAQDDAVTYGFQLTAIDSEGKTVGTFAVPDVVPPRSQIVSNIVEGQTRRYVEHTVDGLVGTVFGSNTWTFKWTAPSEPSGAVTFFAAGNAANGDGSPSGDLIYTTSVIIQTAETTVTISGRVLTADGQALRNAIVRLVNENLSISVTTSFLGFYTISQIPPDQTYTMSVSSRRYRFHSRSVNTSADLTEVDFVGLE